MKILSRGSRRNWIKKFFIFSSRGVHWILRFYIAKLKEEAKETKTIKYPAYKMGVEHEKKKKTCKRPY